MSADVPKAIILPSATRDEKILDVTGTLANLLPLIGGSISSILLGLSGDRRFERVAVVLVDLDERLTSLSAAQEEYLRSEDFEDLLAEAIPRVARERSADKRRIYAEFLADAVEEPGEAYDEQLRFLRLLEELQGDHVRILRALSEPPSISFMGSRMQTLVERLPDMEEGRVKDLAGQLADLRMVEGNMLIGMVTDASDLRQVITPLGERFVRFIRDAG